MAAEAANQSRRARVGSIMTGLRWERFVSYGGRSARKCQVKSSNPAVEREGKVGVDRVAAQDGGDVGVSFVCDDAKVPDAGGFPAGGGPPAGGAADEYAQGQMGFGVQPAEQEVIAGAALVEDS